MDKRRQITHKLNKINKDNCDITKNSYVHIEILIWRNNIFTKSNICFYVNQSALISVLATIICCSFAT